MLARVNAYRAVGGRCADQSFPPSSPLTDAPILRRAARAHGVDMASRDYFDHVTPEGRSPSDRAAAAGWTRRGMMGENIAAGQESPEAVVTGWIRSPGHCANILTPGYRVLGVGYQQVSRSRYTHYWVQLFSD